MKGSNNLRWHMAARNMAALLVAACSAACASSGATPRPFPVARVPDARPQPPASVDEPSGTPRAITGESVGLAPVPNALVDIALALQGAPYRNGGGDPTGFDCSGFTQYVFARYGLSLPRAVHDQFDSGLEIDAAALEPGDLIFFSTVAPGASHVGIVIDADRFIHAPSSRGVVRVEHISARYWSERLVGVRRMSGATLP